MGDQPTPVDDEVERALASMRAGFLAGSEEITAGITSLHEHLQNSPPSEELEAVRAIVSRLATAHELLITKVAYLPASSWDSFKVMVTAVKTQQTVLDQVSHLVKEHVLPRQLESLSAPPFPPAPGPEQEIAPAVEDSFRPRDSYLPHDSFLPPPDVVLPPHDIIAFPPRDAFPDHDSFRAPDPFPPANPFPPPDPFPPRDGVHSQDTFQPDEGFQRGAGFPGGPGQAGGDWLRGHDGYDADDPQPLPLPARFGSPGADHPGLHADLSASVPARPETGFRVLADAGLRARADDRRRVRNERRGHHVHDAGVTDDSEKVSFFARARERTAGFRGLAAMIVVGVILSVFPREKVQDAASRLIDLVAPGGPATVADDDAPRSRPTAAATARSDARVPAAPQAADASPDEPAQPAAAPVRAAVAEPARVAPVTDDRADEVPSAPQPPPRLAPAPTPVAALVAPPVAPPAEGEERFVPVVFTNKDHAAVMRALADLKQQYASVLAGREGEVQPIDMGNKGIWHRLVFLPAGSRPQATKVCDALAAQGYDRCYVREY